MNATIDQALRMKNYNDDSHPDLEVVPSNADRLTWLEGLKRYEWRRRAKKVSREINKLIQFLL